MNITQNGSIQQAFEEESDAKALLGMQVITRRSWPEVPEGTRGAVVSYYKRQGGYGVMVEWAIPTEPPLRDGFTRGQFERHLLVESEVPSPAVLARQREHLAEVRRW